MIHLLLAALLTPSEVLAKAKAAEGVQEPGTYRVETRETLRDATASFVRVSHGDDYVQTQGDGTIANTIGRFNGIYWMQNANGIVLTRSGPSIVDDPYADALQAPESSNLVHAQSDAGGNVVLEIAPRAGVKERRTYDAQSFLLRRVDYDDPRGRVSETLTDYKPYFGTMVATHAETTDTSTGNKVTYDITTYNRVADGSVSLAIPPGKPAFDLGSRVSLPIPAEFSTVGIIVRVSVAGNGLDFILDPGRSESIIDTGVAHRLGLDARVGLLPYRFGVTVSHAVVDDFMLGGLHAHNFMLALLPFSRETDTKKIVGILGGDFFASGHIAIDFGAKSVTMFPSTAPLPGEGWSQLSLEAANFAPMMEANFNGVRGTFAVALGAPQTILYKHYFANFTPDGSSVVAGKAYDDAKNDYDYRNYRFSSVGVGDLKFSNMIVQVVDHGRWSDDLSTDGILGRKFWENFSMIFDYADQALYVKSELPQ